MNATRARANELTLLAIMATVVMLFAAFTAAYLIRRTDADWRPLPLPSVFWLNTLVLLASSITLEAARRRPGRGWLAATIILGIVFLLGQAAGFRSLAGQGLYLPSNPHSSFLYMLTAVHGLHVAGGIVAILYASARPAVVGLVAAYWHFVGVVWLYLLVLLNVL
jgi:cytochrome c oxidase subunit 3